MGIKDLTSFVPGGGPKLTEVQKTPQEEKDSKATMIFMRKYASKINLFLSLSDGGKINNPVDELTEYDLEEIDAFFEEIPNASIGYDSEIANQRITISLETLLTLKEGIILRIYGKFLDLFEDFPSRYTLEGAIRCAKKYEELNGIPIISDDTITEKKRLLLEFEIRSQEDAIANGKFNDEETMGRKKSRLEKLKKELKNT